MKKITAILGVLAAVASLSLADSGPEASATDTKKIVQNNFVETAQKGVKLSGYVDAGYSYNFTGQGNQSAVASRFGGDNAQQGDFNLYAFKVALEKALTSENKAQAGFRADVIIGEDASYLANRNNENDLNNDDQNSNDLFLEQAYAQFRVPVGNGWDWKVGKFVSILGYEVIERPANMNITYGLLWQQFPLYYTGVLTSYRFDDYLDAKLGVVNGANTDNNTTVTPNTGDGVAVIASLNVTAPGGNANWSNNFQYSTAIENNTSSGNPQYSSLAFNDTAAVDFAAATDGGTIQGWYGIYNSWGNWAPKFADDKLLFAFDSVLGFASATANLNGVGQGSASTTWYGAGVYAKYQFNDWFYLASRAEYLGSNNSGKFGTQGSPSTSAGVVGQNAGHVTGSNWWEYTITAGFNVIDNLLIRAEYRLDWGSNIQANGNTNTGTTVDANNNVSTTNRGNASGGPAHYAGAEVVYSF
jgi:hypothetical protein